MAAPSIEDEGRYSEACRLASWAVVKRPWVVTLLVLAFSVVICCA